MSDLVRGRDIIRVVNVAIVYLGSWDESVDCYGVGAFDPDLLDLLVLDLKVLSLADLVAATNVLFLDYRACFGVDELLLQPASGLFVDTVERNALRARRGRIKRDRTETKESLR